MLCELFGVNEFSVHRDENESELDFCCAIPYELTTMVCIVGSTAWSARFFSDSKFRVILFMMLLGEFTHQCRWTVDEVFQ